MRGNWHALHADLVRSTQTLSFQTRFDMIRRSDPALAGFADPAALLDRLHAPGREPEPRNEILRALARAAQRVDPEAAGALLLLALWPGLDAVHGRLSRHFRGRADELASELTSRMAIQIASLDLGSVRRIAATLLRNVERDVGRRLGRAWDEARTRADLDAAPAHPARFPSVFALPEVADADLAEPLLAERLRQEIGDDALLVMAVAVGGERQVEAAGRLGLDPEAGRKRWQRAIRRLREALEAAA
jgi:RNA polymerase sigma-70 factor (ECF subfamily)